MAGESLAQCEQVKASRAATSCVATRSGKANLQLCQSDNHRPTYDERRTALIGLHIRRGERKTARDWRLRCAVQLVQLANRELRFA